MSGKWMVTAGYALTAISVLLLLLDGGMKIAGAATSIEVTGQLGFDPTTTRLLGAILVVATLLYAIPATSLLGAILVTGYLGGAVAIQLQHQAPLMSHVLFGTYIGVLVWGGLWCRYEPLRVLLPWAQG